MATEPKKVFYPVCALFLHGDAFSIIDLALAHLAMNKNALAATGGITAKDVCQIRAEIEAQARRQFQIPDQVSAVEFWQFPARNR